MKKFALYIIYIALISFSFQCSYKKFPFSLKLEQKDNYWTYSVYNGKKSFIYQDIIPAVPDNKRFSSKTDAEKVGKLVIHKLEHKKLPTITSQEIDSLQIKY